MYKSLSRIIVIYQYFRKENPSIYTLFTKKRKKIWSHQKKVVPLHAFSAFGLQSSAVEGTDDTYCGYANVEDSASRLTDVNH